LHVFPGFIDAHVHFRDPGQLEKETFETGCHAAIAGGFTTVIQMPNTSPPLSTPELVRKYTKNNPIKTRVMASITVNREGKELNYFQSLSDAGAIAFTDDGSPVIDDEIMARALELSKSLGKRIVSHAEEKTLSADGIIIEGDIAEKLGVKSINHKAESSMVKRDIELARKTGGLLHICHVSTRESVELIEKARKDGINITTEVTPHHLLLNHEAVLEKGSNAKMNPPLGYEDDRLALISALNRGIIDIIATDHAPHTPQEKSLGLEKAPFGVIGLETAFPVLYTKLVLDDFITLGTLIRCLTIAPARCFNLGGGFITAGSPADLVLIDLNDEFTIDPSKFRSKARNTPFDNMRVRGKIKLVIISNLKHVGA
jgi:dihydroorotase